MIRSPKPVLCAALLLSASGAAAQVLTPRVPVSESWVEYVPTGGGPVAGLVARAGDARVDPSRLVVHLPSPATPLLCVRITSRDGRYSGAAEYATGDLQGGVYRLQLGSKYSPELSRYREGDLAVLAEMKASCAPGDLAVTTAVAGWTTASHISTPALLLNTGTADETRVYLDPDERGLGPYGCSKIQDGVSVAFDTKCDLVLSKGTYQLSIVRWHFRTRLPAIYLKVTVP